MKREVTYVDPPEECNLCNKPIQMLMADAYIPTMGTWANVCMKCACEHHVSYGDGRGQLYQRRQGNTFVKVRG